VKEGHSGHSLELVRFLPKPSADSAFFISQITCNNSKVVDENGIAHQIPDMELIRPFLAGSFGSAAALRAVVTVLSELGLLTSLGARSNGPFGMMSVLLISMIGGAFVAWRAVKHPFSRAKKS
jgi:hypothetical protein